MRIKDDLFTPYVIDERMGDYNVKIEDGDKDTPSLFNNGRIEECIAWITRSKSVQNKDVVDLETYFEKSRIILKNVDNIITRVNKKLGEVDIRGVNDGSKAIPEPSSSNEGRNEVTN